MQAEFAKMEMFIFITVATGCTTGCNLVFWVIWGVIRFFEGFKGCFWGVFCLSYGIPLGSEKKSVLDS
jgi:hypothetical protein